MSSLLEELGLDATAWLLLLSCDDLGFSHAANVAVYEALRDGPATSASIMIPAPWARGAAAEYRGEDVGVHLTINAEHDLYRWGPITQAPSLLDGDGGFPRTVADVWEHADLVEVRREWRAQIERAIYWGFDVTHLTVHLAEVALKAEFFDVVVDLAEDFGLPVRLPGAGEERRAGFPFRALAAERGVVAPDHVVELGAREPSAESLALVIAGLGPGVSEIHLHPALDTPELRAATPDWERRVAEHRALLELGPLLAASGATPAGEAVTGGAARPVEMIGYRALRELMRRRAPSRSSS